MVSSALDATSVNGIVLAGKMKTPCTTVLTAWASWSQYPPPRLLIIVMMALARARYDSSTLSMLISGSKSMPKYRYEIARASSMSSRELPSGTLNLVPLPRTNSLRDLSQIHDSDADFDASAASCPTFRPRISSDSRIIMSTAAWITPSMASASAPSSAYHS